MYFTEPPAMNVVNNITYSANVVYGVLWKMFEINSMQA